MDSQTKAFSETKAILGYFAAPSTNGLSLHWAQSKRLLLGVSTKKVTAMDHSKGGDLDNGKYFDSSYGYQGNAVLADAKYFFKNEGIQTRGWFVQGQIGRSWGKYSYSQDRYERDNGLLGNIFLGIDKKLVESDTREKLSDSNVMRASAGYYLPWIDGNLIKGISVQILGGLESSALTKSQYLSTKWSTKNVSAEVGSMAFLEASINAHF